MKQVFILGAGASKAAADAPLGQELVWSCDYLSILKDAELRRFVTLAIEMWPELEPIQKDLEDRSLLFTPEYFLKRTSKQRGGKYYVDEMLGVLLGRGNARRDDVEFIRQAIYRHISASLFTEYDSALYTRFVREVLGKRARGDVAVICFNYDVLIHEDWEQKVYFDYALPFDSIHHGRDYLPAGGIPLLKLNGSFDWRLCDKCGRLELGFFQTNPWLYDDSCPRARCGGKTRPQIMLPHEDHGPDYDRLWGMARSVIASAEKITVIGYSFPEYDRRMRELFRESISEKASLEVVDFARPQDRLRGEERIRSEYAALLAGKPVKMSLTLDGFEGYVERNAERTSAHPEPGTESHSGGTCASAV